MTDGREPGADGHWVEPVDRAGRAGVAVAFLLLVVATLAGTPALAEWPATGLDPSWKIGLHLCRESGLVVGRDTLYAYGPWGFVATPLVLVKAQWLAAAGWLLGGHLALVAVLGVWVRRAVPGRLAWLAVLPLLLAAPSAEYEVPLALLLATALVVGSRRSAPLAAAVLGAVAAPILLVKTGPGLVAAAVVGGGALAAVAQRRWSVAGALVAGWVAAVALLASVALGSPAFLLGWLRDTLEIASGYAVVLERGGPAWQPLLVVAATGVAAVGVAGARSAATTHLALVAPAAGVWLLAFRHAFNRQETHFAIAFTVEAALLTWVAVALAGAGPAWSRRLRAGAAVVALVAAVAVVPGAGRPRPLSVSRARLAEVHTALRELADPGARAVSRERLRQSLPLGEGVLAAVTGHSVDVLTSELALVEAHDLEWRPRAVMQSFLACTPGLDARDAAFLASDRGPERLLVELHGVDTRDPLRDTPLTWRALAAHWEPVAWDRRWLVLARRERPRTVVSTRLGSVVADLNQPFRLPSPDRGHLEVSVRLEPTAAGRVVGWLWKRPEVRLQVVAPELRDARRVVAATAVNPALLVDPPVTSPAELAHLLTAAATGAPRSAQLVCGGPWAWRPVVVEARRVEWLGPG